MENDTIIQTPEEETSHDSFMEGWEETSPVPQEAENSPDEGGQNQAGDEEGTEVQTDAESQDQAEEENPEDGKHGGQEPQSSDVGTADQAAKAPENKTWTLNHLGQRVSASEADMVVLAQKGLDYDRIRAEYEESRPVMELFRGFAQKSGMSLGAYIANIRAQAKRAEGMSEQDAVRAVEMEDREAKMASWESEQQARKQAMQEETAQRRMAEERRQSDIREFMETFPEAAKDPKSIPREVWAEVRGGRSLVSAYARCSAAQNAAAEEAQRIQAEAERKNQENAARSAGSMRSAGSGTGPKDPFLDGWDED